jgi:hypothetical protein
MQAPTWRAMSTHQLPLSMPYDATNLDFSLLSGLQKRPMGLDGDYCPTRHHPPGIRTGFERNSEMTTTHRAVPAVSGSTAHTRWRRQPTPPLISKERKTISLAPCEGPEARSPRCPACADTLAALSQVWLVSNSPLSQFGTMGRFDPTGRLQPLALSSTGACRAFCVFIPNVHRIGPADQATPDSCPQTLYTSTLIRVFTLPLILAITA